MADPKKNPVVRFIEWCGEHPFATGLFAILSVIGLVFSVVSADQSSRDAQTIEASVEGVQETLEMNAAASATAAQAIDDHVGEVRDIVAAACASPPCWTLAELLDGRLLQTTQTFLNQKIPVAKTKDNFGWEYELDGCKVRVHFLEDVVRYYSIELSQPACQFSWPALFNIQSPQRPQTRLTVGDILDGLYAQTYAPRLGMATGCIDCGNAHEPYVEFVTLNSHADGPYERYFTTDFYGWSNGGQYDLDFDSDHRRAFIEGIQRTLPGKDYWTIEQFCMQDISPDVMATLRSARVTAIGFSWAGRPEFRPDICNRS